MNDQSALLFATIASVSIAGIECAYRALARRKVDVVALGVTTSLGAGLIQLLLLSPPNLSPCYGWNGVLVLCSGVAWSVFVYADIGSYNFLDAGVNAILNSLRFVLLTLLGHFVFAEQLHLVNWAGIGLIVCAITWGVRLQELRANRGVMLRIVNVLAATFAIPNDKFLTTLVGWKTVMLAGNILPGLALIALRPKAPSLALQEARRLGPLFFVPMLLYTISSYGVIQALAGGSLTEAVTLIQAKVVFVFLLSAAILKEREDLLRRGAAAALCLVGVILVTLI